MTGEREAEVVREPWTLSEGMRAVANRGGFSRVVAAGDVLDRHGPALDEDDVSCMTCSQSWPCDAALLAFHQLEPVR